jgi:hypothetical protein
MANPIVLVGLLIAIFGAGVWAFRPPAGAGKSTIKFLGFEVTLDVPALGVMALGVVLVLVGTTTLPSPTSSTTVPPSPPTPAQFKKTVCTGEYEASCAGPHDIFYTCGSFGSDDEIAAKVCQVPSKALRLNTRGGNHCGYALIEVTCN